MRRAVVAVAGLVMLCEAPALAVEGWKLDDDTVAVRDQRAGEEGSASPGGATGGSEVPLYVYWKVGWTDAGFCRERHVTTDQGLAEAYAYALQRQLAAANASGNTNPCPPGTPTVPVLTPDLLARDFWDVRILPKPALRIAPDYAVTGKPVYLQIVTEQAKRFDVPDPLGPPIGIEATSRFVVDWGDGTVEETTTLGGPWPDGDLTHVYTTSSDATTIRVTQRWSASWRAGAQQGTLDTLQTDGAVTFRVTQVQAVRS